MADINKSNPVGLSGTQKALGVRQALDIGQPTTPQFASKVSQATAPSMGQELLQSFQKYESAQQKQETLTKARTQTETMKEMMGRQKESFDLGILNQKKLSALDNRAKSQMLDKELQVRRDEAGSKFLSERQLMDWYSTKARSEEQYRNFESNMKMAYEKKNQVLQAVYNRLAAIEKQAYETSRLDRAQTLQMDLSKMDRESQEKIQSINSAAEMQINEALNKNKVELTKDKAAVEKKISDMSAKASNMSAIMQGVITIASIGATAATGSPAAGMAVAAGGAALGKWYADNPNKFKVKSPW